MKIVQLITSDQQGMLAVFKRTILNHCDSIVIADKCYTGVDPEWIYCDNPLNYIKNLTDIILLLTVYPYDWYVEKIVAETGLKYDQIWYLHHGIIPACSPDIFSHWSKNINYIVTCLNGFNIFQKIFSKVHKIAGLPQFDLAMNVQRTGHSFGALIINGSTDEYYQNTKHVEKIVSEIRTVFTGKIYLKNKRYKNPEIRERWTSLQLNNVQVIDETETMYNYLGAEFIIVIQPGTSYLESLLANNRTYLFDKKLEVDWPENLPSTTEYSEIPRMIKKIVDQEAIDSYVTSIIGEPIRDATPQIMNIIQSISTCRNQ